jgi:hypothetical protein
MADMDLDAMQAAARNGKAQSNFSAIAVSCNVLDDLIDRLRKAEAQHADLLKSMFEIAWSNDSQWQADAAKQVCLRNPALSYRAAPASTPTDSAEENHG